MVGSLPWLRHLVQACSAGGLDLARPFGLGAFPARALSEHQLSGFGRDNPLALVLGNTRALWPVFLEALRAQPDTFARAHPLDDYVEDVVVRALASVPEAHHVYWGHHRTEPRVPLQRIAEAAGLAELGPAHLSIHPTHGPWIGLRAVVVFDVDVPEEFVAPALAPSHCAGCAQPCVAALQQALAASQEPQMASEPLPAPLLNPRERAWLAVRDACPIGRGTRYGHLQLHYHYTKDRRTLRRALKEG